MATKTFMPRISEVERDWFVVDATGLTVGRLATQVSSILRGKHKAIYVPHQDVGDHVIVVNAEKVRLTGRKEDQKLYYRHSGYPGGFRTTGFRDMQRQHPERIIEKAVRGMVPHTNLGREQLKKLHVYAGPNHPHAGQQPKVLDLSGSAGGE
ncbi:MAG: 50S ribosomal protein L13 [Chloroflexi bacterium]|nr:MAG: 50S ribosomal protein L13 [Chloroflexota bacterium]